VKNILFLSIEIVPKMEKIKSTDTNTHYRLTNVRFRWKADVQNNQL